MQKSLLVKLALVAGLLVMGSGCSSDDADAAASMTGATLIPGDIIDVETGAVLESDGFGGTLASFAETKQLVEGIAFSPVYFGFDSYQLAPVEVAKIEQVAQTLLQNHSYVVLIDGHCDERGSNEYNLSLGEQRAQTIRGYLVSLGVDGGRVQTRSFGEEKPAAFGSNEESYRLNRRGEFNLYK